MKTDLYVFGTPGRLGGAATRLHHLLPMLTEVFHVQVVLPHISHLQDRFVTRFLDGLGIRYFLRKDLPSRVDGVALGICDMEFFTSGTAERIHQAGLKLVWSNEMAWAFAGEAEAAQAGRIDRVLFVSEVQRDKFASIYQGIDQHLIPNFIDPESFAWVERANPTFTIGRLSRPDPVKYPADFPVFYEELGFKEVQYRVQAWSDELRKIYRWHSFGPDWELLAANKVPADRFLQSLDLFVYPLGHRVVESWGRSTVEAMLTGCVPLVPAGHHFHQLIEHEKSGFICAGFAEFKHYAQALYRDHRLRRQIGREAAHHARTVLCHRQLHQAMWIKALTF